MKMTYTKKLENLFKHYYWPKVSKEASNGLKAALAGIFFPIVGYQRFGFVLAILLWPFAATAGLLRFAVSTTILVATPVVVAIGFLGTALVDVCKAGFNALKTAINNLKSKGKSEPEAPFAAQPVAAAAAASTLTATVEPTPAVAQRRPVNDAESNPSLNGMFGSQNSSSDVAPKGLDAEYVPENKKTM